MTIRGHIGVLLIATVVWAGFWIAGLPSYYQQYSNLLMIWFVSLVLIPISAMFFLRSEAHPSREGDLRSRFGWLSISQFR